MGMAPGVLINDRYRLVERIAVGSTGQVWRATDLVLARQVAVKILHPERLDDQAFRQRFRGEARHAAQLSHPGIAEVHDFGEHRDLAFLVMEYLPGQSLSTILDRNRGRGGQRETQSGLALSVEATLEILAQVARALQAAHDIGLVHRDIKPANLIVSRDGDVKITDFGTARALDASTMTEPGVVVGTAQYLSPEQAGGRGPTPATDIYALGVVAYTCLAGEPPFNGASPVEIAAAHVNDPPPPLPEPTPPALRRLIENCLAKNPQERPASAAEVAGRLAVIRAGLTRTIPARNPTVRRRPAPFGAAAAGAALAIGGMLLFGSGNGSFTSTPINDDQQINADSGLRHPRPAPGPARDGSRSPTNDLATPGEPVPSVTASPRQDVGEAHSALPHRRMGHGHVQHVRPAPTETQAPGTESAAPDRSSAPESTQESPPEQKSTSPPGRIETPAPTGTPTPTPSDTPSDSPSSSEDVPLLPHTPSRYKLPTQSPDDSVDSTHPPQTRSTPPDPSGESVSSTPSESDSAPDSSGESPSSTPSESDSAQDSPSVLSSLTALLGRS